MAKEAAVRYSLAYDQYNGGRIMRGGTYYSFVVFLRTTVSVLPLMKLTSGRVPPSSSQLMPTAWLFRFVEAVLPLKNGKRLTLTPS